MVDVKLLNRFTFFVKRILFYKNLFLLTKINYLHLN